MYEKNWHTRGLVLVVALVAALLVLLFSELRFPHRFTPFYRDQNGIVSHFTVIVLVALKGLGYVLATVPGMYLLWRERVPHYGLISLLAATEAIALFFVTAQLLFPFFGRENALMWGGPMVMLVVYLLAFELFANMSRLKAWLIASGIVVATFLLSVWMYFSA